MLVFILYVGLKKNVCFFVLKLVCEFGVVVVVFRGVVVKGNRGLRVEVVVINGFL